MSNAAKHRKKAAEFEQLKQIDRAIASYVRAIEESEAEGEDVDVALLNKVGDLALRQGRVPDAVTYYERAVEHYATAGLFNNAIALCNKILRNAPGRSNVYFTLGRICARKGLRGDATRNFLEYAARMQQEGRVEEAMRALGEVADLMPELTEVRRLVDEHAERAGVTLPRRRTPQAVPTVAAPEAQRFPGDKSSNLVFLEVDYGAANARLTPPLAQSPTVPLDAPSAARGRAATPVRSTALPFLDLDAPPVRVATPSIEPSALPEMELVDASQAPEAESPTGFTTNSPDASAFDADDLDFVIAPIESEATFLELPMLDLVDSESLLDSEPPVPAWEAEQPTLRESELMDTPLDDLNSDSLAQDAAFGMELVAFDLADERTDEPGVEVPLDESITPLSASFDALPEALPSPELEAPADESPDAPRDLDQISHASDLADGELDERNADAIEQSIRSEIERMEAELGADEPRFATPSVALEPLQADAPAIDSETEPEQAVEPAQVAAEADVSADVSADVTANVAAEADATVEKAPELPVSDTGARQPWFRPLHTPAPMLAIDAAIAAGAERALREAEADPVAVQRRPPYRLDPHDFILPGELPPLLVSDELVDAGIERANTPLSAPAVEGAPASPALVESVAERPAEATAELSGEVTAAGDRADDADFATEPAVEADGDSALESTTAFSPAEPTVVEAAPEIDDSIGDEADAFAQNEEWVEFEAALSESPTVVDLAEAAAVAETEAQEAAPLDAPIDQPIDEPFEDVSAGALDDLSAVSLTPSLPIAAVAAEANVVAVSRRDELRTLVAERPQDWALRRRLAEALFEAGQRDAALAELEGSLTGFEQSGQIAHAADISEMLVGVSPERVSYHQKRVELAVRLKDEQRLRFAYLDLADTLVRNGEEARAQAVYVRVLEIDPLDDRARAALGSAAPPPPAPAAPEPPAEGFVNLADWLREDEAPVSTRMRMREPTVSGDEDADFASLLRHFKEGVSRSLGDEDFESRYDLGVAYKEMGLLDDAVAEFQKALRSRTHRLPAYEALGQCFVEQGRYQVAATVLSRALHEPGLNDEQRVGVLYLLAYSCEALQRWGEARSYFQRVYATDINFRDVAARLAALEHIAS